MSAKVTVNANGPVKVEGEFQLLDAAGNEFDVAGKPAIFLCRCGNTKNSPFCDGSHRTCQFVSPSPAR